MRSCRLHIECTACDRRNDCPKSVRKAKVRWYPRSERASASLIRRAADVLKTGWYSCWSLGVALYGPSRPGRSGRMGLMVRARRPINRLKKLGLLAVRPDKNGTAEYTLLEDGAEVLE